MTVMGLRVPLTVVEGSGTGWWWYENVLLPYWFKAASSVFFTAPQYSTVWLCLLLFLSSYWPVCSWGLQAMTRSSNATIGTQISFLNGICH